MSLFEEMRCFGLKIVPPRFSERLMSIVLQLTLLDRIKEKQGILHLIRIQAEIESKLAEEFFIDASGIL